MKLSEYKKTLPNSLFEIDNKKSLYTLLRIISLITIFGFIGAYLQNAELNRYILIFLKIILILVQGLTIVGLFVIGHDCGHYAFHKNKKMNDIVGIVAFTPLLNSFYAWRKFHNYHHNNTQVKAIDPDWPELLLTDEELSTARIDQKWAINIGLGTPIGLLIGFWVGMIKRLIFPLLIPSLKLNKRKRNILILQNIFCAILSILFVFILYKSLGHDLFMLVYLYPAILAATIGAFLTWIQHTQEDSYVFNKENYDPYLAQVESSYNIYFPRILEWFWLDINIHMPHHVSTRIPWYNLKPALNILKEKYPRSIKEDHFSFKMIKNNLKLTKLTSINNENYWKLSRRL